MNDINIKCPKDIGYENIFSGEQCNTSDCCYHCWSSSIAKHDQDIKKAIINNILNGVAEEPRVRILNDLINNR